MLRFFRKYNKIILAVFGTALMVVFLIEIPLQRCTPNELDRTLGHVNGRALTNRDHNDAAAQLQVLRVLAPSLALSADTEPMPWLLMIEEARALGLSASRGEADEALAVMGIGDDALARVARDMKVAKEYVRQAVRHWTLVEKYKSLVYGVSNLSVQERVQRYASIGYARQLGLIDASFAWGDPYLSEPLLQRLVHGLYSTVQVSTVVVGHGTYLDQEETPDEQTLRDLFERHKDQTPGISEPHGFGYRLPDRVRFEYLAVRIEDLVDTVEVSEREALDYYRQNPDEFREKTESAEGAAAAPPTEGGGVLQPYDRVRSRIHASLRTLNAARRAEKIMTFARQRLNEQVESMPTRDIYRQLPDDFAPLALAEVARQIKDQFSVDVRVVPDDGTWHTADKLGAIEGIADGTVALPGGVRGRRPRASFANYASSARELEPEQDDPAVRLRLQTKLPSHTLSTDAARYVFRLMAVSRSQTPDFESVRARVETDARRLAAFERLVADKQTWLDRVSQTSLEDVAEKQGTTVRESAPFQRRQPGIFELQVPDVPGVGRDESFVDRVFEIAAASPTLALPPAAGADESVPKPDRPIEAIGVKRQLSLVLVRISQYTPVARTTYDSITSRPELALLVRPYLGDTFDADPLSFDALKQRLQYEEEP